MEDLLKKIIQKNREYLDEQIEFTDYCMGKIGQRNIEKEIVLSTLKSKDLFYTEVQKRPFRGIIEERFKLVYRLSSRYSLIIIVAYYQKILKVINVIKTSKEFKLQWRKKILK